MNYPVLRVYLGKIISNATLIVRCARRSSVEVVGVTKGLSGVPEIAGAYLDAGIQVLGDSRIRNLARIRERYGSVSLLLVRIPMISEAEAVVRYADASLISEISTAWALSREALRQGRPHKVILMVDVGDLREGIWPDELRETVLSMEAIPGIILAGIGTNTGCYGGIIPSVENTGLIVKLARDMEEVLGRHLRVSGGNTATYALLEDGLLPPGITDLRIGEGILLGYNTTCRRAVNGASQDTMILEAEIIECGLKPSVPLGEIGCDVRGNVPVLEDKGMRLRAIVALGRQDTMVEGLTPLDDGIEILGASSDHTILDVTDCHRKFKVGDVVGFRPNYEAMLLASTSPYVRKVYIP